MLPLMWSVLGAPLLLAGAERVGAAIADAVLAGPETAAEPGEGARATHAERA